MPRNSAIFTTLWVWIELPDRSTERLSVHPDILSVSGCGLVAKLLSAMTGAPLVSSEQAS